MSYVNFLEAEAILLHKKREARVWLVSRSLCNNCTVLTCNTSNYNVAEDETIGYVDLKVARLGLPP